MAYTRVKSYNYGARLRHFVRVETNDIPDDPTTITVYFSDPSGTVTGPFTPVKDATGLYEYARTYTSVTPSNMFGLWDITWRGVGNAEGAITRQFQINSVRATF